MAKKMDWGERLGPWAFLGISLAVFAALGVLPVWQYVSNHHPGVPFHQVVVQRCDSVHSPSIVCARTDEGSHIAVQWEGHLRNPRSGSHLTVYEKNGIWRARDGRSLPFWAPIFLILGALGAVACGATLVRRLGVVIRRH